MSRLFLVCIALMLGGFAVGRLVLQPQAVEAASESSTGTQAAPAPRADSDSTLFLRPGDGARMTRTQGPLAFALEEIPGHADGDALTGAWRLHFKEAGLPDATHELAAYAVTGAMLVQLDPDPLYEVLVLTYTGGAHCCTTFHTFDKVGARWQADAVEAGSFTFEPRDLDGDGAAELVSEDPRFEFAFGSFAGSRGPSRIVALRGGRLREATREPRFHAALAAHRDALAAALPDAAGDPDAQRGLLAALAAQDALLGAPQAGMRLAAATYEEADREAYLNSLGAFLAAQGFVTPAQHRTLRAE